MSSPSYEPKYHTPPVPSVDDCGSDSHSPPQTQSPSNDSDSSSGGASLSVDIPTLLGLVHGIVGDTSADTPIVAAELKSSMQSTDVDSSVGLSVDVGTGSEQSNIVDVDVAMQADGNAATVGALLNAALLNGGSSDCATGPGDSTTYDGNVGLTVDLGPALDSTLDLITTSSSLFDVPALDIVVGDMLDG